MYTLSDFFLSEEKAPNKPGRDRKSHSETDKEGNRSPSRHRRPPESIPNPMPGIDPKQTPGIDHPPAESDPTS